MPILIIILVALLIAQIGFWNALGAILGAVAMVILLVLIAAALLVAVVAALLRRGLGR